MNILFNGNGIKVIELKKWLDEYLQEPVVESYLDEEGEVWVDADGGLSKVCCLSKLSSLVTIPNLWVGCGQPFISCEVEATTLLSGQRLSFFASSLTIFHATFQFCVHCRSFTESQLFVESSIS